MMRIRTIILATSIPAALACLAADPATAKPYRPQPSHAANVAFGTVCAVADAHGEYHQDNDCQVHAVTNYAPGGASPETLQSFIYSDHGTLPPEAPRPQQTRRAPISVEFFFGWGLLCTGTEITTPSGEYRSDCHYSAGNLN